MMRWLKNCLTPRPTMPVRRRKPGCRLQVETLEDRVVPTAVFVPSLGQPTLNPTPNGDYHYTTLSSPTVYLIFAGSDFGTRLGGGIVLPTLQVGQLIKDANTILQSPYLTGLTEYGSDGIAHYGGSFLDLSLDDQDVLKNPLNPKYGGDILQYELNLAINSGGVPAPPPNTPLTDFGAPIYVVVLDGTLSTTVDARGLVAGSGGSNFVKYYNGVPVNFIHVGSDAGNSERNFGRVFSHEMIEKMSDPTTDNRGAQVISPTLKRPEQIADGEPENYLYLLRGSNPVWVQPYWSANQGAFIVPDGSRDLTVFGDGMDIRVDTVRDGILGFDRVSYRAGNALDRVNYHAGNIWNDVGRTFGNIQINMLPDRQWDDEVDIEPVLPLSTISIQGNGGDDLVNLRGLPDRGVVNIANNGGFTELNVTSPLGGTSTSATLDSGTLSLTGINPSTGFQGSYLINFQPSQLRHLNVHFGGGGNNLTVNDTPNRPPRLVVIGGNVDVDSMRTTLYTGGGIDTTEVNGTTGPLTIEGEGGADIVNVGNYGAGLQLIGGEVLVKNAPYYTGLTVIDTGFQGSRTATLGAAGISFAGPFAPAAIGYVAADLRYLSVFGGYGADTYTVTDTPNSAYFAGMRTSIFTEGGKDTVKVQKTTGALFLDTGTDDDTVIVGDSAHSVGASLAPVTVDGGGGSDTLTLDDRAAGSLLLNEGRGFIVTDKQVEWDQSFGPPARRINSSSFFNYANLAQLNILGNRVNTGFHVLSTAAATPVSMTGGVGNDTFTIGDATHSLDNLRAGVTLDGKGGTDTLMFDDSADMNYHSYDLYTDHFDRGDVGQEPLDTLAHFAHLEGITLNVSRGGSSVGVLGTAANAPVTINGWAGGQDEIVVYTSADAIHGAVTVHGQQADLDFFILFDFESVNPHTYTMSTGAVKRDGQAPVTFDGLVYSAVNVSKVGGNLVNVKSVAAGAAAQVQAQDRDRVVIGSHASGTGGTMADVLGYTLVGGYSLEDRVDLVLDDSGDKATTPRLVTISPPTSPLFPYTVESGLAPGDVYWNLGAGASVSLRGGHAAEAFVVRGAIPDVGLSIFGGAGRDVLIAGATQATLDGGGGGDILIGGTTDYDNDDDTLLAILNEWAGSGTASLLNAMTVHKNGAANQLTGGDGLDLFFAQLQSEMLDRDALLETWITLP